MNSLMRWVAGVLVLPLAAGCVSEHVTKAEKKTTLKARAPKPRDQRLKVAVVDFEEKAEYGRGRTGAAAADILVTELVTSKQFTVFERQQLSKVMDEQKLGQSGAVDPTTAQKVGRLIGVDYVIYGAVTNAKVATKSTNLIVSQSKTLTAEVVVDVRWMHVESSEVVFAESGRGVAEKSASGSLGIVGGSFSYDPGLIGDALRAAIQEMLDSMIDSTEE